MNICTPKENTDRVLEVESLHKSYGALDVLKRVDLTLKRGEIVLFRGKNGVGKTTLINVLTGNLVPDSGHIHLRTNEGEEYFTFPKPWWQKLNGMSHFLPERLARAGVGRTWQDYHLFPSLTLEDNIILASRDHAGERPFNLFFNPSKVKRHEEVKRADAHKRMEEWQLEGRSLSKAGNISLGQGKRTAIAQAVNAGAQVLFLDEPLAGLDEQGIESVVDFLRELSRDHGIAIVIVEHAMNTPFIAPLVDTVWNLVDGKVETISTVEPSTELLNHNSGWLESGNAVLARSQNLPRGAVLKIYRPKGLAPDHTPALEVRELVVKREGRLVLGEQDDSGKENGINFTLMQGELAVLEAPNGWGKTTLFDSIMGLLDVDLGTIYLNGTDIRSLRTWERVRSGAGYLRADSTGFPSLSLAQISCVQGVPPSSDQGFQGSKAAPKYGHLSGGQKQGYRLRTFLEKKHGLNLLDEPFLGLDMHSEKAYKEMVLSQWKKKGTSALVAIPKPPLH